MQGHKSVSVEARQEGDIAVLTILQPPANGLTEGVRRDLEDAFSKAVAMPGVAGVVLCGANGNFSAGLDFESLARPGTLSEVANICDMIEASEVPVVAALSGLVSGAGASLALAAHARIAAPTARLAWPEVKMHLIPCGGATQRLPRLIGAQRALQLMLSGQPTAASDPILKRVINGIAGGDVIAQSVAHARKMAQPQQTRLQTAGFSDPGAYLLSMRDIENQITQQSGGAAAAIVRAVEAALLLPFDQGVALEVYLGEDCGMSKAAQVARHLAKARQRARSLPGLGPVPNNARHLCLGGDGAELPDLIRLALDTGWAVAVNGPEARAASQRVEQMYRQAEAKGVLPPETRAARLSRLSLQDEGGDQPALTIHTGTAPRPQGDAVMRLGPPPDLATPAIWFRTIAQGTGIAEISAPSGTNDSVLSKAVAFARGAGKLLLRSDLGAGNATAWIEYGLYASALDLRVAGWQEAQIDAAARDLGCSQRPFAAMNAMGQTRLAQAVTRFSDLTGWPIPEAAPQDPPPSDVPLIQALHAAMVNVAMHGLARGAVTCTSDVDLIHVVALGHDASRGGPLFEADEVGLLPLLRTLEKVNAPQNSTLSPVETWSLMIREGQDFYSRPYSFEAQVKTSE